jgi:hypothetical protein
MQRRVEAGQLEKQFHDTPTPGDFQPLSSLEVSRSCLLNIALICAILRTKNETEVPVR